MLYGTRLARVESLSLQACGGCDAPDVHLSHDGEAPAGTLEFLDSDTNRVGFRAEAECTRCFPVAGSGLFASCNVQLRHAACSRNPSTGQFLVEIPEILLEFFNGLTLSHVVGILLQVSQPHILILPVDVANRLHCFSIPLTALSNQSKFMPVAIMMVLTLIESDAKEPARHVRSKESERILGPTNIFRPFVRQSLD